MSLFLIFPAYCLLSCRVIHCNALLHTSIIHSAVLFVCLFDVGGKRATLLNLLEEDVRQCLARFGSSFILRISGRLHVGSKASSLRDCVSYAAMEPDKSAPQPILYDRRISRDWRCPTTAGNVCSPHRSIRCSRLFAAVVRH